MKQYYAMIAAAGALWGLLSLFFEVLSAAGLTSPQAVGVAPCVRLLSCGCGCLCVTVTH